MTWRTYSLDQVHVVPAEDQTAHDMTGLDCICGPDVEFHERPLVMHHSLVSAWRTVDDG